MSLAFTMEISLAPTANEHGVKGALKCFSEALNPKAAIQKLVGDSLLFVKLKKHSDQTPPHGVAGII